MSAVAAFTSPTGIRRVLWLDAITGAGSAALSLVAPGVVSHHITAGATYTTGSGVELTGYVMHAPKQTVRGVGFRWRRRAAR